jgi:hypothetical protein
MGVADNRKGRQQINRATPVRCCNPASGSYGRREPYIRGIGDCGYNRHACCNPGINATKQHIGRALVAIASWPALAIWLWPVLPRAAFGNPASFLGKPEARRSYGSRQLRLSRCTVCARQRGPSSNVFQDLSEPLPHPLCSSRSSCPGCPMSSQQLHDRCARRHSAELHRLH